MSLQEQIQYYRKKECMSQSELAEKLHITRQAVSNWERGKSEPDIESLQAIATIFHITLDELINNEQKVYHKQKKIYKLLWIGAILQLIYMISLLIVQRNIQALIPVTFMSFLTMIVIYIFGNCIKYHDYSMLAGYDQKIAYHEGNLDQMLQEIEFHICVNYVMISLCNLLLDGIFEMRYMPYLGLLLFIFQLLVTIIGYNIKYRNEIFVHPQDIKNAKKALPGIILVMIHIGITVVLTLIIFEIKQIKNNTIASSILGGIAMVIVLINIIFLFLFDHQVKQQKDTKKEYVILVCCTVLGWILLYLAS